MIQYCNIYSFFGMEKKIPPHPNNNKMQGSHCGRNLLAQDPPSTSPEESTVPPISQKRTHESSPLDSDKETSSLTRLSLQIMRAQQSTFVQLLLLCSSCYFLLSIALFLFSLRGRDG